MKVNPKLLLKTFPLISIQIYPVHLYDSVAECDVGGRVLGGAGIDDGKVPPRKVNSLTFFVELGNVTAKPNGTAD